MISGVLPDGSLRRHIIVLHRRDKHYYIYYMRFLPLLVFFLLIPPALVRAQTSPGEEKPLTWLQKNFFHSIGGTAFLESNRSAAYGTYKRLPQSQDTAIDYEGVISVNILTVTYDPRINLVHYRDFASLSFNMPVEFALSVWEPYDSHGTFVLPAFIDLNLFNHSTYNNIDSWGGHAGIGYQYSFGPLIPRAGYAFYDTYERKWSTLVFRAGIKGPFRDKNCFLTVTWNIPHKFMDDYDHVKMTDRFYFKIAAGILLNYD